MGSTLILIRKTPSGTVGAHAFPFPTMEQIAEAAADVLYNFANVTRRASHGYAAELAALPVGDIYVHEASGYHLRVLTADHTADKVAIMPGLRVLNTDMRWGSVSRAQFMNTSDFAPGGKHFDGRYSIDLDAGGTATFDGTRLALKAPPLVRG